MDIIDKTIQLLTESNALTFYVITMQTYTGKTLYLKATGAKRFEWTFNYSEALWFDFDDQAEAFAKKYFKNFTNWEIKEVYDNLNGLL